MLPTLQQVSLDIGCLHTRSNLLSILLESFVCSVHGFPGVLSKHCLNPDKPLTTYSWSSTRRARELQQSLAWRLMLWSGSFRR